MYLSKLVVPSLLSLFVYSCNGERGKPAADLPATESQAIGKEDDVLTEEEQAALTPREVIDIFTAGNERFMNNDLTERKHSAQVRKSAKGQYPKAIVLSCVDSRVPVEDVFDRGIGDVFVTRVAGNFVNPDILGSMEYACKVAGSKVIVVLGHEYCGAVKAAVEGVEMGNITSMLANITPAIAAVDYSGPRTVDDPEFMHLVCEANVVQTIARIREESPLLRDMESAGEIEIVGAVYDMDSGRVSFMNEVERD